MIRVYRDLKKSIYKTTIYDITFVFSSQFNKERFERDVELRIEKLIIEFESRFRIKLNLEQYGALIQYIHTEKRGFLIVVDGGVITCLNNITFGGVIKTIEKLKEL